MAGPSIVVERPPDGWTHVGGPHVHLVIDLDEEDERTLAASDAADNDDLDDVVEILTVGGMRKARSFVGVHTENTTRIVAFGPVVAVVTAADGQEHEVRSTSSKVWTDVELDTEPARIVLRVLTEKERSETPQFPKTSQTQEKSRGTTVAAPSGGSAPTGQSDLAPGPGLELVSDLDDGVTPDGTERPTEAAQTRATEGAAGTDDQASSAAPPVIPTFGATRAPSADAESSSAGRWGRSWARPQTTPSTQPVLRAEPDAEPAPPVEAPEPARPIEALEQDQPVEAPEQDQPVEAPESARPVDPTESLPQTESPPQPEPPAPAASPSRSGLPSWASRRPLVGLRAAAPPPAAAAPLESQPQPTQPQQNQQQQAPRPPPAERFDDQAPDDVESTWRPAPDPGPVVAPTPAAADSSSVLTGSDHTGSHPTGSDHTGSHHTGSPETGSDEADPSAPSYDFLFGHTGAVADRRKLMADLAPSDDDTDDTGDTGDTNDADDTDGAAAQGGSQGDPAGVDGGGRAPGATPSTLPAAVEPGSPGVLISSVPWATSTPVAPPPLVVGASGSTASAASAVSDGSGTAAGSDAEAVIVTPTFAGRRTPPPAPSLRTAAPPSTPPRSTPPPSTPSPSTPPAPIPPAPPAPAPSSPAASASVSASSSGDEQSPASLVAEPAQAGHRLHERDQPQPPEERTHPDARRDEAARADGAASPGLPSGPSVLAVLCSAGHPTPPHSEHCRVCRSAIPDQSPFAMPRPPLGVLRLSTGDVVSLDRSVLLGRAPKLGTGLTGAQRPHVVKVPSPQRDVSRNHVEVVLEGWHVLIRDLGTTNGTTVSRPGVPPVRLRANDQQVLEPGTVVSMADEVTFTFDAGEGS